MSEMGEKATKEKKPKLPYKPPVVIVPPALTEYKAALAYCQAWQWHPLWVNAHLTYLIHRLRLTETQAETIAILVGVDRDKRDYYMMYNKASR